MTEASYIPGALVAVAGDKCLALLDAAPDSQAVAWIWQRAGRGAPAEELLTGLLGAGFDGMDGFVLLSLPRAGQRRLFCRGTVAATVVGGSAAGSSAAARVDGAGMLTWLEYLVARNAERVVLGEQPDGRLPRLPIATGVLLAGCVIAELAPGAARPLTRYDLPVGGYSDGGPSGAPAVETTVPADQEPPANALASTRPDPEEPPRPPVHPAGPARQVPRGPVRLIDAVSWEQAPSGELTVGRARQTEPAALPVPPDRTGPLVPALICPHGHVNPPSAAACHRCGAPLPQDTVVVPRPALGVLRLSTGDVLTLDRGAVMGRDPDPDPDAGERPHVVRLPSAGGDISRTHLRVTLDGWHALVTDLHSTNGTLVSLPGRDPEQLRPGEPVPIKPGTLVVLADGVDFRYEAAE